MTKTFKIGEWCYGGIARITTKPRGVFSVELLDWNTKQVLKWKFVYGYEELEEFMCDMSTPYWADVVCDYFKDKGI